MTRLFTALLEWPIVYRLWQAPFVQQKLAPLERHARLDAARRVLDLGCGPGTNVDRFARSEYVGVDVNPRYIACARERYPGTFVVADLRAADLTDLGEFDVIILNSVLHHIDDDGVRHVLREASARLAPGGSIHILELVLPAPYEKGWVMAKLDRGAYPRTRDAWRRLIGEQLVPIVVEDYWFGFGLWAMLYCQARRKA